VPYKLKARALVRRVLITPKDIEFAEKKAQALGMIWALHPTVRAVKPDEFGDYPGLDWPQMRTEKHFISFRPRDTSAWNCLRHNERHKFVPDRTFRGTKELLPGNQVSRQWSKLPREVRTINQGLQNEGWHQTGDNTIIWYSQDTTFLPNPRNCNDDESQRILKKFSEIYPIRETWALSAHGQWGKVEAGTEWLNAPDFDLISAGVSNSPLRAFACIYRPQLKERNLFTYKIQDKPQFRILRVVKNHNPGKSDAPSACDDSRIHKYVHLLDDVPDKYEGWIETGSYDRALVVTRPHRRIPYSGIDKTKYTHRTVLANFGELSRPWRVDRYREPLSSSDEDVSSDHYDNLRRPHKILVIYHRKDGDATEKSPLTPATERRYDQTTLQYKQYDKNCKTFRYATGLLREQVTRRITKDVRTGKVIADEIVTDMPEALYLRALPNLHRFRSYDLETTYYYKDVQDLGPVNLAEGKVRERLTGPNGRPVHIQEIRVQIGPTRMSANAPVVGRRTNSVIRRWLIDTGCGYDLVDEGDLRLGGLINLICRAPKSLRLSTPGGLTAADKQITMHIAELEEDVTAHVFPHTPNVLSIGRRCQLHGYSFHWEALSSRPYLVTPGGRRVELRVDGYIPYLVQDDLAAPGPEDMNDDLRNMDRPIPNAVTHTFYRTIFTDVTGKTFKDVRRLTHFLDVPPDGQDVNNMVRRQTLLHGTGELVEDCWLSDGKIWKYVKLEDHRGRERSVERPGTPRASSPGGIPDTPVDDAPTIDTGTLSDATQLDQTAILPPPAPHSTPRPQHRPQPPRSAPQREIERIAEGNDPRPRTTRRDLDAEARSLRHLLTHMPKLPHNCKTCRVAKAQALAHFNKKKHWANKEDIPDYLTQGLTHFAQRFTLDHIITKNELSRSYKGHTAAVTFLDLFTGWRQVVPVKTKSKDDTVTALKHILGAYSEDSDITAYSDQSHEIMEACVWMNIAHDLATPGCPQSNSRAERNNRHLLEGTRSEHYESGVPTVMWDTGLPAFAFIDNITPKLGESVEDTPYYKRFGVPFPGKLIPYGAKVKYKPTPTFTIQDNQDKDSRAHIRARSHKQGKIEPPTHTGVFLGYRLNSAGQWSGDYLCAELKGFSHLNWLTNREAESGKPLKHLVSVHQSNSAWIDDMNNITFPLQDAARRAHESIEGMNMATQFIWDDTHGNCIIDWENIHYDEITGKSSDEIEKACKERQIARDRTDELRPVEPALPPASEPSSSSGIQRERADPSDIPPAGETATDTRIAHSLYEVGINFTDYSQLPRMDTYDKSLRDTLCRIVQDPNRFARARRGLDLLGVVPVFDENTGRYKADIVRGVRCGVKRGSPRPPHITVQEWTTSYRVGYGQANRRRAWQEEWYDAILQNAADIISADHEQTGIQDARSAAARSLGRTRRRTWRTKKIDRTMNLGQRIMRGFIQDSLDSSDTGSRASAASACESDASDVLRNLIYKMQDDKSEPSDADIPNPDSALYASQYEKGEVPLPYALTGRGANQDTGSDHFSMPMPIDINTKTKPHRVKIPEFNVPFNCCVAEPINARQIQKQNDARLAHPANTKQDLRWTDPKFPEHSYEGSAQQACDNEWLRLDQMNTWYKPGVRDMNDVQDEAAKANKKVKFGKVFNFCVIKGAELAPGTKGRKYKGRTVFQGNAVWDENWDVAMFQELSQSPATMEASKLADLIGLLPGYITKQADAKQAYTQSQLRGDETWIALPQDQWPKEWHDIKWKTHPVVPLLLSLYGHPQAGAYWEQHCDEHLRNIGWETIDENDAWRSCYYHPKTKAVLILYVDDFKISAPSEHHDQLWADIQENFVHPVTGKKTMGIEIDEITAPEKFLGCLHTVGENVSPITGKKCRTMTYDMSEFADSCVKLYCELAKVDRNKLKKVPTPFLDVGIVPDRTECQGRCSICAALCCSGNSMHEQAIAPTDNSSTEGSGTDIEYGGKLKSIASRVLMKILYMARMARPDLLKAIGRLATKVTKWTPKCDMDLERLVAYINSTLEYKLVGWCNNTLDELELALFADADFAAEKDGKSTSGVYLEVHGSDTRFMLQAISKKQTCISHSTPEAEIVAADFALRTEGLPALIFWDKILGKPMKMKFWEDNETMIQVCKTGKNPTMRHLPRTHRVSVAWLYERFRGRFQDIVYVKSEYQAADLFTKQFTASDKWQNNLRLIHVVDTKKFWKIDPFWSESPEGHRKKDIKQEKLKQASRLPNTKYGPMAQKVKEQMAEIGRKKRTTIALISKYKRAMTYAGAAGVQMTEHALHRKRKFREGLPATSFHDLKLDAITLLDMLIDAVKDKDIEEKLKPTLPTDHGRGENVTLQRMKPDGTTVHDFTDPRFDKDTPNADIHHRIQSKALRGIRHWDPYTELFPDHKHRNIITTFFPKNKGPTWSRKDLGVKRFQIIRDPRSELDVSKIERRVTVDMNTGRILQDAYFDNGCIQIAKEFMPIPDTFHTAEQVSNDNWDGKSIQPPWKDKIDKALKHTNRKIQLRPRDEYQRASPATDDQWTSDNNTDNIQTNFELPEPFFPAAAAAAAGEYSEEPGYYDRMLLEFCCGEDSYLSTPMPYNKGCKFIRLTERLDMTTQEGLEYAMQALNDPVALKGNVLLWAAIPCTGGSAWNRFNWAKGGQHMHWKIRGHWKMFRALFKNFKILADRVKQLDGAIVNEWPLSCGYWREKEVTKYFYKHQYYTVHFDGCAYNLRSKVKKNDKTGKFHFIRKPWRIAYSQNAMQFGQRLNRLCPNEKDCPKSSILSDAEKHAHVTCGGKDTKLTESYTWEIIEQAHYAFSDFCRGEDNSMKKAIPSLYCNVIAETGKTMEQIFTDEDEPGPHDKTITG